MSPTSACIAMRERNSLHPTSFVIFRLYIQCQLLSSGRGVTYSKMIRGGIKKLSNMFSYFLRSVCADFYVMTYCTYCIFLQTASKFLRYSKNVL